MHSARRHLHHTVVIRLKPFLCFLCQNEFFFSFNQTFLLFTGVIWQVIYVCFQNLVLRLSFLNIFNKPNLWTTLKPKVPLFRSILPSFTFEYLQIIGAYGWKYGEGVAQIFLDTLGGPSLSNKCQGAYTFLRFILLLHFYVQFFFENSLGVPYVISPYPLIALCASLLLALWQKWLISDN